MLLGKLNSVKLKRGRMDRRKDKSMPILGLLWRSGPADGVASKRAEAHSHFLVVIGIPSFIMSLLIDSASVA
jgi:hypothetical protein